MMKQGSSKDFDSSDPATLQVRKMKTEINSLISQHRDLKNQIKEFTEKFKAEHNGAEPGKDDRKSLGDVLKNFEKLSKSIKKKMKELEEFQAENGGVGASTKIPGAGTPSTKLQPFNKSSKKSRSDADDGSVSSGDSVDS
jgi:predicted RNase H-like nuclease (RuvC/YqgF family)